ncbi:MAG TPA: hypothetical protein VFK13_07815 [Gemmatimonadaceae bacterium]|nr:hypothetical protein [Gemmatimonadaceae bacterium]
MTGVGALTITLPPNLPAQRTMMFGRRPTVTFPPLVVTLSRNFAGPFQQWLASGSPKNGSLTFLSTDVKTPLFVLDFTACASRRSPTRRRPDRQAFSDGRSRCQ